MPYFEFWTQFQLCLWNFSHTTKQFSGYQLGDLALNWILTICTWSPLDCKEIQAVHPKGIFIGRTDAEAETPILWPPDAKNWLTGKDLNAGKDWGQEEKGTTEDEMVGWHHWLNGHEFEQALRVSDGQQSLVHCSPWGCKESDTTDWTELNLETARDSTVRDPPQLRQELKTQVVTCVSDPQFINQWFTWPSLCVWLTFESGSQNSKKHFTY